ncbi:MAG: NusG domain II-containing protein [Candidatus Anstonellales archaeon]
MLVIFLFFLLAVYFFNKYYFRFSEDDYNVLIFYNDEVVYRDKISKDNIVKVNDVLVEIKNKKVRVVKSSCPYKVCVNTGWIEKPYQSITCVPNRVHIKIDSNKHLKFDSITY